MTTCIDCESEEYCKHIGIGIDSVLCRKQRIFKSAWTGLFMSLAYLLASKSKDPRTKVGAVITSKDNTIISMGYNGFPRGVKYTDERLCRIYKQFFMVHAEQNAILNAIRNGSKLDDTTIYCTLLPCVECCKAIIQTGISRIIVHDGYKPTKTKIDVVDKFIKEMLQESNVDLVYYNGEITKEIKIYEDIMEK